MWLIRAGLSNPLLSARQVQDLCQGLTSDGKAPVSYVKIGSVRNAFAMLLRQLQQEELGGVLAGVPVVGDRKTAPVFVRHLHDEAAFSNSYQLQ